MNERRPTDDEHSGTPWSVPTNFTGEHRLIMNALGTERWSRKLLGISRIARRMYWKNRPWMHHGVVTRNPEQGS